MKDLFPSSLGQVLKEPVLVPVLAAALVLTAASLWASPLETGFCLLVALFLLVTLCLGGALLISLQYVLAARWLAPLRRLPESLAAHLPLFSIALFLLLIPLSAGYPWVDEAEGGFRALWLNRGWFLLRAALYLSIWSFFSLRMIALSRKQDFEEGVHPTRANIRWSTGFLIGFGATFWLACTDWLLSLRDWHSTLFGMYNFAGLFLAGAAALVILCFLAVRTFGGRFRLTQEQIHDLGKLLFTLSCIWMYLWFSQYLLIWYANIPAETRYFVEIQNSRWLPVALLLVSCNWIVPFSVLLTRWAKMDLTVLLQVSLLLLLGRWADVALMVLPGNAPSPLLSALLSLLLSVLGIALLIRLSVRLLPRHSLMPRNDPLLTPRPRPSPER